MSAHAEIGGDAVEVVAKPKKILKTFRGGPFWQKGPPRPPPQKLLYFAALAAFGGQAGQSGRHQSIIPEGRLMGFAAA